MNAQTINEYINSLVIFLGENTAKILFSLIIFFLALKGIQLFTNHLTRLLEATKIAEGCPALVDDSEGAVRVYEAMPM